VKQVPRRLLNFLPTSNLFFTFFKNTKLNHHLPHTMAEPGGFDFDSITFDDDTDTNKEAKPTTEKPDVNMEDVKPQSQAAALLIASDIFNSDIFNTRANQQSPVRCCPTPVLKHKLMMIDPWYRGAPGEEAPLLEHRKAACKQQHRRRGELSRT
jgi:hypothetical protein